MDLKEPKPGDSDRPTISERRVYFGDDRDYELNSQGWVFVSQQEEHGPLALPEGTKSVPLEPHLLPDGRILFFLVYDPTKAETRVVDHSKQGAMGVVRELQQNGWRTVDTNIARSIHVKTIPKSSSIPQR